MLLLCVYLHTNILASSFISRKIRFFFVRECRGRAFELGPKNICIISAPGVEHLPRWFTVFFSAKLGAYPNSSHCPLWSNPICDRCNRQSKVKLNAIATIIAIRQKTNAWNCFYTSGTVNTRTITLLSTLITMEKNAFCVSTATDIVHLGLSQFIAIL